MANITIDGVTKEYPDGLKYEVIATEYQQQYDNMIALVLENGKIRELIKPVHKDCTLSFLTLKDVIGHKTYVRTAIMTLIKSVYDVLEDKEITKVNVEFAIGQGYYINIRMDEKLTREMVEKIRQRMKELVDADRPIIKRSYPVDDAVELFRKYKMFDKVNLFRYRRGSSVNIYCLDGYYDYYYGYMLPSTGYLKYYDVMQYEEGLLLLIPGATEPDKIDFFEPREKLFHELKTATQWG